MKALIPVFLLVTIPALAQQNLLTKAERSKAIIDTQIAAMVADVNADSIRSYVQTLASFETRHSLSDTIDEKRGIGAARRWVANKFRTIALRNKASLSVKLDPFEIKADPKSRVNVNTVMKNVVGTLAGSDPEDKRVLIVSGHLDSRNSDVMDAQGSAPGANDDASGVALVIELARVISRYKLPCTVIFTAVQGEEQGLLGARHMANRLKSEKANVLAMLNNDIVGNTLASETGERNGGTVRIFSEMIPKAESEEEKSARQIMHYENDSRARQLARYVKEVSEVYVKGFTATLNARADRALRGGDHLPFAEAGFPAIRFTEFHEDYRHQHQNIRTEGGTQYGDLPEFVDYAYIANVARMNLVALVTLAKAPGPPSEVKMRIDLGNITNLTWQPPVDGPKAKGYYVLVRETWQPFWEKKYYTTNTTAALPYSKDNYFFAVQAVGADGHPSQIVVPSPSRE